MPGQRVEGQATNNQTHSDKTENDRTKMKQRNRSVMGMLTVAAVLAACASNAQLLPSHRYSFTTDVTDSIGTAHGTLVDGALAGTPAVSGGQLMLNNPGFTAPSSDANHLSLPVSILPASGSVTIEYWFTFAGSGFFTEGWVFSDRNGGANPPGEGNGQYFMHTISNPQGGPVPAGGGSSIAQASSGFGAGGDESRAYSTTTGIGAGGGGFLDDGVAYMSATVLDGDAGTLSYYVFRVSDGAGGLQSTIPAIALSSYSFTEAFIGRSPFDGDNATAGSVDEFRIYNEARSAALILADFNAGPNALVPEPSSVVLFGLGGLAGLLLWRRRS
jgi:hypothetical protein